MIDFDATVLAAAGAAFGEQVTYLPGSGGALTVTGVFDDRWQEVKYQDGVEMVGTRTVLNLRQSALPALPVQGELLRIRGRIYVIAEPPEADTVGDVRLYLRAATDAQASVPLSAPTAP